MGFNWEAALFIRGMTGDDGPYAPQIGAISGLAVTQAKPLDQGMHDVDCNYTKT